MCSCLHLQWNRVSVSCLSFPLYRLVLCKCPQCLPDLPILVLSICVLKYPLPYVLIAVHAACNCLQISNLVHVVCLHVWDPQKQEKHPKTYYASNDIIMSASQGFRGLSGLWILSSYSVSCSRIGVITIVPSLSVTSTTLPFFSPNLSRR